MRKKIVGFGVLFFFMGASIFAQGIEFKHISFSEALELAKKEDKFIFVDFYTQWCGPCKRLAKGPFMDSVVGNYYNKNFINLKLDAEKEGLHMAQQYQVSSYPTLMFINGEGEVIYRGSGSRYGDNLVQLGENAINSVYDKFSLENIKTKFAEKQGNEKFLKFYIQKMIEYGVSPTEGIDAWLKVQTEIKESDMEMMEFLRKYSRYLLLNTKAEEILKANYDEYSKELDERRLRVLKTLNETLYKNTLRLANRTQNADLLKVYIEKRRNNLDKIPKDEDLNWLEAEYFLMKKDYPTFMKKSCNYMDSLMNAISIKDIHKKDREFYESLKAGYENKTTESSRIMLSRLKAGRLASKEVKKIVKVGHKYLQACCKEGNLKPVEKWINYSYKLIPDYYAVDNLKADLLYVQGKTDKAIKLKKIAIEKFPSNYKKLVNIKYKLELMEGGEDLFKNL